MDLDLCLKFFLIKMTIKIEKAISAKSLKTYRKILLFEGLGHALRGHNRPKNGFKNGMNFRIHFRWILARFGRSFWSQKPPKIDGKIR